MRFDVLSLFPKYFETPLGVSLLKKAQDKGILAIHCHDMRSFGVGRHRQVDDRPYGGGPGMVLQAGPVLQAIRSVKAVDSHVVYLSPQGATLSAKRCRALAQKQHLILLCGHYEGVDERAVELEVDEEISIGDYVVMSGAVAALVLIESVVRFVPGVVGEEESVLQDSFEDGILDVPHYTRPRSVEGKQVPSVLLSGDHARIRRWREQHARAKTRRVRPDLIEEKENEPI